MCREHRQEVVMLPRPPAHPTSFVVDEQVRLLAVFNGLEPVQDLLLAQTSQGSHVATRDFEQLGRVGYDCGYTRLAQQMQHRVGGAIRVILHRVRVGARELVAGVKTGDLDDTPKAEGIDELFPDVKKVVVVKEVLKGARMDEEGRLDTPHRGGDKGFQFAGEMLKERFLALSVADDVTDDVGVEYAAGEGAEIQPDHHGGNPAASSLDHGLLVHNFTSPSRYQKLLPTPVAAPSSETGKVGASSCAPDSSGAFGDRNTPSYVKEMREHRHLLFPCRRWPQLS